jgi:serine/threonine protein kinase
MDSAEANKRALEIVDDAHGLTESELETYLERACGDNSLLRREVLCYLEYDVEQTVITGRAVNESAPKIPDATTSETRYDLGDEIARGGMGVVMRAFDNNIRRNVAVKVLKENAEHNAIMLHRFHQEAQICGQLQHPGIPPVYEIGRLPDERPFIAMKLVKGATLAELLARRGDSADDLPRFLSIFEQVCQAIAFAHRRGVIHRDLKPANVMVGEFGEVQVMDWGIAKLIDDQSAGDFATESDVAIREATMRVDSEQVDTDGVGQSTRVGQIMGTPGYMPPEQYIGKAEKTSDVFTLGAILCEILTGERMPDNLEEASDQLDRSQCDQKLAELAKECMQRDLIDRPEDAGIVATRIAEYSNGIQRRLKEAELATARAEVRVDEERKRRHRTLWTIAVVGMLLATVLVAVQLILSSARQRNLADRTQTAVESIRNGRGAGVPGALSDLGELPEQMVIAELEKRIPESGDDQQRSIAYGLARFGITDVKLLVARIADSPSTESQNLIEALESAKQPAVTELHTVMTQNQAKENWQLMARLATVLLYLDDASAAEDMCRLRPDPVRRTVFIDEFSRWHGDVSQLAQDAANIEQASFRSGLCLSIGSISADSVSLDVKQAWQPLLEDWYLNSPDPGHIVQRVGPCVSGTSRRRKFPRRPDLKMESIGT